MNDNEQPKKDRVDESFPLPGENADGGSKNRPSSSEPNHAADLVRRKLAAIYADAPDAAEEGEELSELGGAVKRSKHQQFIYELTNSGKSLPEIQQEWHDYYAGLTDIEKHQVWQEFYSTHAAASHLGKIKHHIPDEYEPEKHSLSRDEIEHLTQPLSSPLRQMWGKLRRPAAKGEPAEQKPALPAALHSMLFGLGVGAVVLVIFMFGLFNERFIAPFIQPSRNVSSTPIIDTGAASGANPEIIIPKINVEIPVIYDVDTINEGVVQKALQRGVVHYADTAMPGVDGNGVIVGHSSNNIFNPGKYKFAFVLLHRLETGDKFYLQKDGKRYTYVVYKREIVDPSDVAVMGPTDKPATFTLITCDPPGTSWRRLVVVGEQISPDIKTNLASNTDNRLATKTTVLPGNSPSLWSRLWSWL